MEIQTAILTIGIISLLEGLFLSLSPTKTRKLVHKMIQTEKGIKRLGLIELIVGLILIILALVFS